MSKSHSYDFSSSRRCLAIVIIQLNLALAQTANGYGQGGRRETFSFSVIGCSPVVMKMTSQSAPQEHMDQQNLWYNPTLQTTSLNVQFGSSPQGFLFVVQKPHTFFMWHTLQHLHNLSGMWYTMTRHTVREDTSCEPFPVFYGIVQAESQGKNYLNILYGYD